MSETGDKQNELTKSNTAESPAGLSETNGGQASPNVPESSETSERKKQANRENARHSTGPKTAYGKAWVRLNALKHGFYASDVVIPLGDGKESQEEFDLLHEGLRRAWAPEDAMEECLVRTIAEIEWRQRRAARAEVGEIRRQMDSYYARQSLDFVDEYGFMNSRYWSTEEEAEEETKEGSAFWSRKAVRDSVRNTTLRIDRKLVLLAEVRTAVEETGYLGEELQRTLDAAYGKDHVLAKRCHEVSQLVLRQHADETKSPDMEGADGHTAGREAVEQEKNLLLRNIALEMNTLKEFLTYIEEAEDREHQATLLAHNLPSKKFVDTLTRYESMLERRKQNAIKVLLMLRGKKK